MKIAIAQVNSLVGDTNGNSARIKQYIKLGVEQGVAYVHYPCLPDDL